MQQPVSIRDLWDGQTSSAVAEQHAVFQEKLAQREALERSEKNTGGKADE